MRSFLIGLLSAALGLAAGACALAQPRAVEVYPHGMVSAANPLAAEAGRQVLIRGGNAVDAAVAIQAVLGLVEPQSSGLGGGAFLMVFDGKTHRLTAYNGRRRGCGRHRPW